MDRYPPLHTPDYEHKFSYDLTKNTVAARSAASQPTPTQRYLEEEQIAHFQRMQRQEERAARKAAKEKQAIRDQLRDAELEAQRLWKRNDLEIVPHENDRIESALLSASVYLPGVEDKGTVQAEQTPLVAVNLYSHESVPVRSIMLLHEQQKQTTD